MKTDGYEDEYVFLEPGEPLFKQGDVGGDLFHIQDGCIEIYTHNDAGEVQLALLGENEIIGMMSLFTKDPRLASARAHEKTTLKKFNHESIRSHYENLPQWVKIVLKDFNYKIRHINKKYAESQELIEDLKKNQLGFTHTVRQVCSLISTMVTKWSININGVNVVLLEECKNFLEQALMLTPQHVEQTIDVLTESGMLKVQIESEKKRKVFTAEDGEKLFSFAKFIRDAKSGPNKKLVDSNITNKEMRILLGIVTFTKKLSLELTKTCTIRTEDLSNSLEKMIGVKFDPKALKTAESLGIITLEYEDSHASFIPSDLSRTITNIKTYQKIKRLEHVERSKKYHC